MIVTALQIQDATQNSVHDTSTMMLASQLYHGRDEMTSEDFAKALFQYSAHLSSLTATLVTEVLLTKEQMEEMCSEIKEFDNIAKDVE